MTSTQKKNAPSFSRRPENIVEKFEKKLLLLDIDEVEGVMLKLKFLGLHFDPFSSEISRECKQILNHFKLMPESENPYSMTRLILQLLDKTEERLNLLKQ